MVVVASLVSVQRLEQQFAVKPYLLRLLLPPLLLPNWKLMYCYLQREKCLGNLDCCYTSIRGDSWGRVRSPCNSVPPWERTLVVVLPVP